jgi:UDP-N-acetyl-D-galactosamine dehydrogenase
MLALAQQRFTEGGWPLMTRLLKGGTGVLVDVKSVLDRASRPAEIELWRL